MAGLASSRRVFGSFLRDLRKSSGRTHLAASLALEVSRQVIMRLEGGYPTKLTTPQIGLLLDLYDVSPDARQEALCLWGDVREQEKVARLQGNSKGFWQPYADQVAPHFPQYLQLESDADQVCTHQLVLVHGLLQTSDYRRALVKIEDPGLSNVDVERRVELNTRRQAKLYEDGFSMTAFLSEAVLRHRPGAPAVMAAQLRWLSELSERENIVIRVVPFEVGPHRGLTIQSFTMLTFPAQSDGPTELPLVYLEGAMGALYLNRADALEEYREAVTALHAVALSEDDTRKLVSDSAKEYVE
ncbi:helix-turn-helix domain-containing protein [Nocardia sp. NPDC088792]|uniref:helix-turn-helix domain-containing protein n=1 Tax=Nocardia sp. NPDC088792 TaxID=3364332 RepID=UPI0038083031